jgi:LemA protein
MRGGWAAVVAVIVVILLIPGCLWMGSYNSLVSKDEQVKTAWAQVETVLQRRYDLIPNLVNTVKGYVQHEKGVLEEVTRLRSQWGEAKSPAEKIQASAALEGALGRLMVVVENYPTLRAYQNFVALQDELAGTENRISVERRRYNEAVLAYNKAVRTFPSNLVAGLHGFVRNDAYFQAASQAKEAPKVDFGAPR